MAWRRPGDKSLSEPMMVSLLAHIYASLNELITYILQYSFVGTKVNQWHNPVNPPRRVDITHTRPWQTMANHGQATSHYLNQWWLVYWRIYASLNELIAYILQYSFVGTKVNQWHNPVNPPRRVDITLTRPWQTMARRQAIIWTNDG